MQTHKCQPLTVSRNWKNGILNHLVKFVLYK
jgi:hypothetical protein